MSPPLLGYIMALGTHLLADQHRHGTLACVQSRQDRLPHRSSSTIMMALSGRSVPDQWVLISWPGTNLGR